jgi:hypothetical protein
LWLSIGGDQVRTARPATASIDSPSPLLDIDRVRYLMLRNPIYRGEIVHNEQSYPGEHTPIIDQGL